jgi:hypothetical protein
MPLPLPEQLLQTGASLPLPSQQAFLQTRYTQLVTPDQLAPDLFTRVAQGLKPLPKPQAVGLGSMRGDSAGNNNIQAKPPSASSQPEKKPEPKSPQPSSKGEEPKKPSHEDASSGGKSLQYLTRDQLMNWQNQLSSNLPTRRQKAATEIFSYLANHPDSKFNPVERRALAALVLNMLQDTDKVVRQWGLWSISEGHVQFAKKERSQSPYRELDKRIDRMLSVQNPAFALEMDERPLVESIKRNWKALTTLQEPSPPNTELTS